jgi:hypothetical protein
MIKLTLPNNTPLYLKSVDNITLAIGGAKEAKSFVNEHFYVRETPEEIMALLEH